MQLLILKYALTAAIIVAVSEIAKRTDRVGALIGSLPIVSLLVMIWLYVETKDTAKIGSYAYYSFWFVMPSLPMFLLMPYLLKTGVNFWLTLLASGLLTLVCFGITALLAKRFFGVALFG